jgi:hypothetical protein
MPPDLARRLDMALRDAGLDPRLRAGEVTPDVTASSRSRRPAPSRTSAPWTRNARRRPALLALATVLSLVCAIGGVAGLNALIKGGATNNMNAGPPAEGDRTYEPSPQPVGPADGSPGTNVYASGTDYRRETLASAADLPQAAGQNEVDAGSTSSEALAALATPTGFAACLAAVQAHHPGQVRVADFARYLGSPALVIQIGGRPGGVVVAVGPDCGRDGDPHELAVVNLP